MSDLPAINGYEWGHVLKGEETPVGSSVLVWIDRGEVCVMEQSEIQASRITQLGKMIAVANAAMADDDPRKITRKWVEYLRRMNAEEWSGVSRPNDGDGLLAIADVLESYLPPA